MGRIFHPTAEEVRQTGATFGYPEPGRYAVMMKDGRVLGMERERPGEFDQQCRSLPKYYPYEAELVVATLDSKGVFTEE